MNRTRSRSRSPVRRDRGNERRREKRPVDAHSDKMVYLNNLPFDLKWNTLKDIIREKVGQSAYVEFLEDDSGKFKGAAVLDFDNRAAAQKAVEVLHRMEIGGRNITARDIRDPIGFFRRIKQDIGVDFLANRVVLPGRGGGGPRRREIEDDPLDTETYGLSPTFLAKLNIKPPLVNRVFVTNISYSCGVGQLFDIFSLAGKIAWVDLQLDNEGKTKGMAVVQYSHPIEAVQAISMLNNQRVFDRTISVKLDRFEKEAERPPGELPAGLRAVGMGLGANGAPLANVASVLSTLGTNAIQQQPVQPFSQPLINSNPFMNQQGPQQQFVQQPIASSQISGFGGNESSLSFNQQQGSQPQSFPSGNFYPNQQPVVNSGPSMNSSGYGNPNNGYGKMSSPMSGGGFGGSHQKSFYDSQPSRVILIKNLPLDYTWNIVHDRVQKFGEVENVEIVSPGVAKVRFVRVPDAERTKSTLSGTTVEGRIIAVEYL
ncbi:hypothetical protein FO519_004981 [Halicephalobus sp. NKZ332]|nr:hypothetical protein FO519_004981 [Halicephalobus sp. NKZ332]